MGPLGAENTVSRANSLSGGVLNLIGKPTCELGASKGANFQEGCGNSLKPRGGARNQQVDAGCTCLNNVSLGGGN